jgi:hypothetical protein
MKIKYKLKEIESILYTVVCKNKPSLCKMLSARQAVESDQHVWKSLMKMSPTNESY